MKIRIRTETWDKMKPQTYERLKQLTLGRAGEMWYWAEERSSSTRVFVARDGRGKILGWCAAKHCGFRGRNRHFDVDVYVHPTYRRRGVGTKLLKHAIRRLRPTKRALELPEVPELTKNTDYKSRIYI